MKTALKIIKWFINNKKSKTIREISQSIKADYRITYITTQHLITQDILHMQTVGKSSLCKLNESFYGKEIYEAEEERKEEILRNVNIKQLCKEIMSKVNTGLFVMLLFGSYAKGKQTKNSDLDLMFISNDKDFEHKVTAILSILPLKTHVLVFTEEEFIRMKDAKKPNVVQEAIENNIILYGIEAYYQMKCQNFP